MLEILNFIFSSFWVFIGVVILIYIPCQTIVDVIKIKYACKCINKKEEYKNDNN